KTHTRRVAKCALLDDGSDYRDEDGWPLTYDEGTDSDMRAGSPYGQPGDRLWVRETWCHTGTGVWNIASARAALDGSPIYRADGERPGVKWWPGIHMPRE